MEAERPAARGEQRCERESIASFWDKDKGVALLYLASPLALGSYWAVLPALMILPLLAARIRNEEDMLMRELAGYAEYRQKVKYRLLPGIW